MSGVHRHCESRTGHPSLTIPPSPSARISTPPCRLPQQAKSAGRKGTMAKEICISSTPHETRLAILEDDQLAEIYYERENEYTLAGSIYNGRVTRVLPGMQSAFVDIGLERDAFLYVTDFLELEEAEDTDELEKAAASGGNQPPREVRQGNGHDRGHKGGREQRESQASAEVERAPAASDAAAENDAQDAKAQDGDEAGAKRWRGRRRRRGGRSGSNVAAGAADTSDEFVETGARDVSAPDAEEAEEIQASAAPHRGRSERSPEPFVLPGESLSKYGGTPAEAPGKSSSEPAAARPASKSTYKPASLIESPIVWDGSGLLPGESLARRRGNRPESGEPAREIEEQASVQGAISGSETEHPVEPGAGQALDDNIDSCRRRDGGRDLRSRFGGTRAAFGCRRTGGGSSTQRGRRTGAGEFFEFAGGIRKRDDGECGREREHRV